MCRWRSCWPHCAEAPSPPTARFGPMGREVTWEESTLPRPPGPLEAWAHVLLPRRRRAARDPWVGRGEGSARQRGEELGAEEAGWARAISLPLLWGPCRGARSLSQLREGAPLKVRSCSPGEGQLSSRVCATPPILLSVHCPFPLGVLVMISGVKGNPALGG